jgi:hypothetical protein
MIHRRVLCASSQRPGCLIETLARLQADVSVVADLALMENGEDDFTAFGTTRRAWLKGRCIGMANVEGEYADICALGCLYAGDSRERAIDNQLDQSQTARSSCFSPEESEEALFNRKRGE